MDVQQLGDVMDYVWVVILLALGLAMLFKPKLLWKIEQLFAVRGGEPTELYLALMRIGGLFFTAAGVIVFLVSLM